MIHAFLAQIQAGGLNATLRAVRDRFQEGGSMAVVLLLIATALVILWITNLIAARQRRARATTLPADPSRLFADLVSRLGLPSRHRKALKQMARDLHLANPTVILVSPALFDRSLERWRAAQTSAPPESAEPPALMTEIRATLFPSG